MIKYLFNVLYDNRSIYSNKTKDRIASWLLRTLFNQRCFALEAARKLKIAEGDVARLTKKIDRLYMICAEYEVYGESYTAEDHKQYAIEDIYYHD